MIGAAHRADTALRNLTTIPRIAWRAAPARASLVVATQLIAVGAGLIAIYATRFVVDSAVADDRHDTITATLVLALAAGLSVIAQLASTHLSYALTDAIELLLDGDIIHAIVMLPTMEHHDDPHFADQLDLIRTERSQLVNAIRAAVFNLRWFTLLAGTLILLVQIDRRFLILPLFALPHAYATRSTRHLVKAAQQRTAEAMRLRARLYARAISNAGAREQRIYGLGPTLCDRAAELTRGIRRDRERAARVQAIRLGMCDLLLAGGGAAAFGWSVVRAGRGEMDAGNLVLTATLVTSTMTLMGSAMQSSGLLVGAMLAVERYRWLGRFVASNRREAAARPPERLVEGVKLERASFAYAGRATPALQDIDLDIAAGQVVALVGENGAGKSTLVNLLCGLYAPTSGRITVDGIDLAAIDPAAWYRRLGALTQDYVNFELTLGEAVALGDLAFPPDRNEIIDALRRAGDANLSTLHPDGLDAALGPAWGGLELSGGQWQKLALGRAIVRKRPLLVLLDEPAASLDPVAEHAIFERIAAEVREGRARGQCTILISHRFSTTSMADTIAVLAAGRIVERGSHAQLLANGGHYARLYELHAHAYR